MMNNNNISTNSISPSSSSNVRPPPSVAASIGLSAAAATSMPTPSADTFNPSNPLAGVYSPKTSHLSIVQPMLDQYVQQPHEANNESGHEEAAMPLPPGWYVKT